ncbi:MAG: hypothetical protein OEN56_10505 [Gemmatimonadota bacterium]|nr:hypothetical protein [Gemmatimonadota bacterium]
MNEELMDRARQSALAAAERSERLTRWLLGLAAVFEAGVLVAVLLVIDWSNSTHQLVFLCACLMYAPLALVMVSLHSALDGATQRVLVGLDHLTDV